VSVQLLAADVARRGPGVADALAALRHTHDSLAELLDGVFDDLESLSSEVDVRGRLLDELRTQAIAQASELRNLCQAEAEVRTEYSATRLEVEHARQQLAELPAESERLRGQLQSIELERVSLETELEALRVRGAELTEQLAALKRESAEERAEWSGEIQQLRRAFERQAELLADRLVALAVAERPSNGAAETTQDTTTAPKSSATPVQDNVLGSVVAQFEMLQRDRQRRRGS
jgi:chromosome segregation ATPase